MTTPLTFRAIAGHSKGLDRRAYVNLDGVDCLADTMRADDVNAYVSDYLAINAAERIILTESPIYAGCYRSAFNAAVKRNHREGAYLASYSIDFYTAKAMGEARDSLCIAPASVALTSHYEVPAARRIVAGGDVLNVRLVHRDGSHTDLTATLRAHSDRFIATLAA